MARTQVALFIMLMLLVQASVLTAEEGGLDVITASLATPEHHWWEEQLWIKNVDLTGRGIEIDSVGETVFIDYFRFVNSKTGAEGLWTEFDKLQPAASLVGVSNQQDFQVYQRSGGKWAVRSDHMGGIGNKSLYAGAHNPVPALRFFPDLKGEYDIYVGLRATHFPVQVELQLYDAKKDEVSVPVTEAQTRGEGKEHDTVIIAQRPNVYYAWPTVAKLSDGELLVVTYEGKGHTHCHGKVVLYRSKDNGRTWDDGTVVVDTVLDDRDPGIMVTQDDTIIVSSRVAWWEGIDSSTIDPVRASELVKQYGGGYIIKSKDRGETWSDLIPYPFQPHGPIELGDGSLFAVGNISGNTATAYTSTDQGDTWSTTGIIFNLPKYVVENKKIYGLGYWEPHFMQMPSGRIVVYIRAHTTGDDEYGNPYGLIPYMWITYSDDYGKTWSKPYQADFKGYPPHCTLLADGRLLLSYGYRWQPYGQRARISDDGLDFNKYDEIIIRDDAPDGDLGYPASIQLDDGTIMTVYYQKEFVHRKPVLMATFWSLD
ncbi:MAG: sialidase family protein [Limnochordia bacterium]|nr:sialidase family protein [Limnochordia bacterium]